MFKINRIESLDILTPDVPRMVDFYHGVLGLPFFMPWEGDEDLASLDAGNLIICLMRTTSTTTPPKHSGVDMGVRDPQGFDSIAFEVDDLEAAMAALDGKVTWITDGPGEWREPDGTFFRHRVMHDPDGNMVYIQVSNVVRA
jgi:glyoxylase I family protein